MSAAFEDIYRNDAWTHGSGPGSILQFNLPYMRFLENFIQANAISSIVDVGCGDFQFMKAVNLSGARYDGYDVVASVVDKCRSAYASDSVRFHVMPADPAQLPAGDLAIVKDVLIHLDNMTATNLVSILAQKFRFVLAVNNCTDDHARYNADINVGQFRPVDISRPPFAIPCATVLRYSQDAAYDPRYPWLLARLLKKRVWPGKKHVQLIVSSRAPEA